MPLGRRGPVQSMRKRCEKIRTLILAIVASIICEDYMGRIPIRKRAIALWPAQYQRVSDALISDKSTLNYQVNFQEMLKWKAYCS